MKRILPKFKFLYFITGYSRCLIVICFFFFINSALFAQALTFKDELLKVTALSDGLNNKNPTEKIYLQFDKPYYAIKNTTKHLSALARNRAR
jgi:hypothetical protein